MQEVRAGRRRDHCEGEHRDGPQCHPALPQGRAPAEARRAHADPRGGELRRADRLRPDQAGHRGARRAAACARLRRCRDQRRHHPGPARAHHRPAAQGKARHPRRHRRRRPRPRRRADQPRGEPRHPHRHRVLRAPHRPDRPCRPQRRRHLVRHSPRAAPAAGHREGEPDHAGADAAADRRGRQRPRVAKFTEAITQALGDEPGRHLSRARAGLRAGARRPCRRTSPPRSPYSPRTASPCCSRTCLSRPLPNVLERASPRAPRSVADLRSGSGIASSRARSSARSPTRAASVRATSAGSTSSRGSRSWSCRRTCPARPWASCLGPGSPECSSTCVVTRAQRLARGRRSVSTTAPPLTEAARPIGWKKPRHRKG